MVHSGEQIDFDDLQSERRYSPTGVYAMTKLANELFSYELARKLEGSGVTANCLHPGVINTSLYRNYMGSRGGRWGRGWRARKRGEHFGIRGFV